MAKLQSLRAAVQREASLQAANAKRSAVPGQTATLLPDVVC